MIDPQPALQPLPYHSAIRDYLRREEREVWEWFASQRSRNEHTDATRFELLKSTYRVDHDDEPKLYETADEIAKRLSLDVPITIYQAQNPEGLNASLAFVPGEAHLVFHGPIRSRLSEAELRALLAHELSHQVLFDHWGGEFLIADQILSTLTNDRHADATHFATARLFRLFTEVFCDRGALLAVDDPLPVVSMLVKVSTGVEQVNPASYLRQADEVLAAGEVKADEFSHPEVFIRARALKLWAEKVDDADGQVAKMLTGRAPLDELDLLAREQLSQHTRSLVDLVLHAKWMQTGLTLGHARLFFDGYEAPKASSDEPQALASGEADADPESDKGATSDAGSQTLTAVIKESHETVRDYFCFVMLDFVTADRDLEELPLAATLKLAEQLGLHARYRELAGKELRLRKKQLEKLDQQRETLLAKAEEGLAAR